MQVKLFRPDCSFPTLGFFRRICRAVGATRRAALIDLTTFYTYVIVCTLLLLVHCSWQFAKYWIGIIEVNIGRYWASRNVLKEEKIERLMISDRHNKWRPFQIKTAQRMTLQNNCVKANVRHMLTNLSLAVIGGAAVKKLRHNTLQGL